MAEAQYGMSGEDFSYRVRVALRECSETQMWLRLLHETDSLDDKEHESIQNDCVELLKILTSISVTMEKKKQE